MTKQDTVVPYLEYSHLGALAEKIICEYHPSRQLPIPVDDIIDPRMEIDIFPLPGLTRATTDNDGIIAFVNSDLTCITVDEEAWQRQTPRFRFSIARTRSYCRASRHPREIPLQHAVRVAASHESHAKRGLRPA